MKKLGLCLLPLLLVGCNNYDSGKSEIIESNIYSHVYRYDNVNYTFDEYLRCNVYWQEFIEGQGYSGVEKHWLIYLKGYYFEDRDYNYNSFYVCVSAQTTDYYLYVIG